MGYVPDVDPYFARAAVFVAPLRYGAGVKGKVGQAMAHGLPMVTTTIGAEGMAVVDGVHALARDDPSEFGRAIQTLAGDGGLWNRLSLAGADLIRSTMSRDATCARLRQFLADTVGQISY
jgi:glycosyltransferase involved in cell wall biosynthesis